MSSKISKKNKRMMEGLRAYLVAERAKRVLSTNGVTKIPLKTGVLHISEGTPCIATCDLKDADNAGVLYLGREDMEYIVFLTDANGLTKDNCEAACSAATLAISKPIDDEEVMIFGIVEEDIGHYTYGLRIIRDGR